MKEINEQLFLDTIYEEYRSGQRYCFVLGAGASRASGIRTGRELMTEWRGYLLEDSRGQAYIQQSAAALGLPPKDYLHIFTDNYEQRSEDYFTLFDLRFATKPGAAYNYLEQEMEGKNPSLGYYHLAALLAKTENRVVITTNFDSLTEDAVFYYTGRHPLVVGHESLAPFIKNTVRRPIVAKIHRDLLFRPMNRTDEMARLKNEWKDPLVDLLSKYIPIVVGYSGGDQTFMSLLEEIHLPCIFWCTTSGNIQDEKIRNIITNNNGYVVKILGFDEMFFQLGDRFQKETQFKNPCDDMNAAVQSRCDDYNKRYEEIRQKYSDRKQQYDRTGGEAESSVDARANMAKALGRYGDQQDQAGNDGQYAKLLSESIIESITGNYDKALALCSKAIALEPTSSKGYDRRSIIYHKMGRYDEALADANKAIELESSNAELYYSRGVTLHEMGRYDEALIDTNNAIELDPNDADFYSSRGITLHKMERYDEALADKSKAIKLDPNDADFYNSRGITLHAMGRYDEALADKNRAIELDPDNAKFYDSRGTTYHEMGRYDEALIDTNKAIELNPDNARFYDSRSATYHKMGRYDEALADTNKAIELEPNNADFYKSRGITLRAMGRHEEAEADFEKARDLTAGKNDIRG